MSHLAVAGAICDETGMASAMLAREVGYPGSSIAFAQLLSGMERSGLIEREVRGKRTYRISATPGASYVNRGPTTRPGAGAGAAGAARTAGGAGGASGAGATARRERAVAGQRATAAAHGQTGLEAAPAEPGDFDYDELARRLLVEVVRRLAAVPAEVPPPASATEGQAPSAEASPGEATLEQTVASLEQELASARTMHGTLTEENARLRQQLQDARRSLALARRSAGQPVTDQLDAAEVSLLERLLSRSAEETRGEDTG